MSERKGVKRNDQLQCDVDSGKQSWELERGTGCQRLGADGSALPDCPGCFSELSIFLCVSLFDMESNIEPKNPNIVNLHQYRMLKI